MVVRSRLLKAAVIGAICGAVSVVSGCSSSSKQTQTMSVRPVEAKQTRSKEYFAESEYGVKASPRVTNKRSRLQRGGGREQVGKPYQIRGKWYYPKEEPGYSRVGKASWYGDAFHGRLTANGEIYDMTHLTAAHPTMPLPSYARVTNLKNGASVVVRVNDRGPYAHGRVIDMSRRAAEMLGYQHDGTAKVKVDYVGRAPLDGQDDQYLMASYVPGNGPADPSVGMPTGVMVAMNGATPSLRRTKAPNLPGVRQVADSNILGTLPADEVALAPMSYAPAPTRAASAFDSLIASDTNSIKTYVFVGAFQKKQQARDMAASLSTLGKAKLVKARNKAGKPVYELTMTPRSGAGDDLLKAAWAKGASDAMTVRE